MFDDLRRRAELLADGSCERSWGASIVLTSCGESPDRCDVREKFLVLKPGCGIVLERHLGFSELWIPHRPIWYALENGDGEIESHTATPHRAVVIPRGRKHKLHNPGPDAAFVYEVQTGVITDGDKVVFPDEDIDFPFTS